MTEKYCINLMTEVGDRFRIYFQEKYDTKNRPRKNLDPWMMTLRGRGNGVELYPAGGDRLRVDLDRHGKLTKRLLQIKGVELVQDGDHEKTVEFSFELFNQINEVLKFHRRPNLTDEQREVRRNRARKDLGFSDPRRPQFHETTHPSPTSSEARKNGPE